MSVPRDRDPSGRPRNSRPRDRLGRPLPRDASSLYVEEELPSDPAELLAIGIAHFDAGNFFPAHEAWETAWHAAPEDERDFWQGITQVAVGFTHQQRGNPTGATTLLDRGAAKLAKYPDGYKGFPTARIGAAARAAAAAIARNEPITFPRIRP